MERNELNNSNIIRNISTDQKEILYNIMQLYNNGEAFECDMTASSLKFYTHKKGDKYTIPVPEILFDVCPMSDNIHKIEPYGNLPLENNSISSIVIDLPFVVSPPNAPSVVNRKNRKTNIISSRFASYYPVSDLYRSYYHWISEAFRVLKDDGICVFKCQNTVSGGYQHNIEEYSFMVANNCGFYVEDRFLLEAKAVIISAGKYKKQRHARKYTSTFYVFRKNMKMHDKFDLFHIVKKHQGENIRLF